MIFASIIIYNIYIYTLGIQVPSQKVFGVAVEGPSAFSECTWIPRDIYFDAGTMPFHKPQGLAEVGQTSNG